MDPLTGVNVEDLLEPLKPARAMIGFGHSTRIIGSSMSHTIRENA